MLAMTYHVFSFVLFRILDKALGEVSRLIEEKSILFWIFALVIVSRRHFFFVIKGNEHYVIWSIQSINTKLHEINDVRQPFDKSHNFTLDKLFVHLTDFSIKWFNSRRGSIFDNASLIIGLTIHLNSYPVISSTKPILNRTYHLQLIKIAHS